MSATRANRKLKPLAQFVGTTCTLIAPAALANTVFVTNCSDSGAASLRQVLTSPGAVNSGDTVDLTSCSVISITTGEIVIGQSKLTLQGSATGTLVQYTGSGRHRVFKHVGTGTLRLDNVDVALGKPYSTTASVSGGCIYSKGTVYLSHSILTGCSATARNNHSADGGGVFAALDLIAESSTISSNKADGDQASAGGGVETGGTTTIRRSVITGNVAAGPSGEGGGISTRSKTTISQSTIDHNKAAFGGGVQMFSATQPLIISDSTISSNTATATVGGVAASSAVTLQNSTIAFNTATAGKTSSHYAAPGFSVYAGIASFTVTLQSSVLSNNTYGAVENDFSTGAATFPAMFTVTVNGANNLIRNSTSALPSAGLITGVCPLLGRLRNNGGLTQTHALLSHSPAIDKGNNSATLVNDQRGAGFPRLSGPGSIADIGAYEVQQNDIVFDADFEGCP